MAKKVVSYTVDAIMYVLLIVQLMHAFVGSTAHEFIGMGFFLCLIIHVLLKVWWFGAAFRKNRKGISLLFDIVTVLMIISIVVLELSSMGVSRLLFPWFNHFVSPTFHRYMGTAVITLGVLHGGLIGIKKTKKKKLVTVLVIIAAIGVAALGIFGVPYMNRHFKSVEISWDEKVKGDKITTIENKPLVVYFTRVGNTDFDEDVDAVSGASLLKADGALTGSNQLLSAMLCDMLDCKSAAITLTGKKYPSSYNDTVVVASEEINSKARPQIEPIDVSSYNSIILVYPIWWYTIPAPVATFLEQNDFSGKTIYLVATQGSSGYANTVTDIEALCPNANVVPLISVYCENIPEARETLMQVVQEKVK